MRVGVQIFSLMCEENTAEEDAARLKALAHQGDGFLSDAGKREHRDGRSPQRFLAYRPQIRKLRNLSWRCPLAPNRRVSASSRALTSGCL